jgi:RimJ/RimL family protein N-acetyltransferase
MIFRYFKGRDLIDLQLQDRQLDCGIKISIEYANALEKGSNGQTALIGDRIVGCAGVSEQWAGRAIAWAWLAGNQRQYFIPIHRACIKMLDKQSYKRIEAYADVNFEAANRWLKMLGFIKEGVAMKSFLPCGSDAYMWVRLK